MPLHQSFGLGLLLAAAACAGQGPAASLPVEPAPGGEESPVNEATRGYVLFNDCSIHPDSDGAPSGLYVRGRLEEGRFVPEGEVQGEGPVGASTGTPGWVELRPAPTAQNQSRPARFLASRCAMRWKRVLKCSGLVS